MRYSKAFTLMKGLPPKHLKILDGGIKLHKRVSLKKLFSVLYNNLAEDEPEGSFVYKATFGKKYIKKEDYLLRNEYRLLYDWLLEQSCRLNYEKTELNSLTALQFLLQYQLFELFEDELAAEWKNAVQADDVHALSKLSELNIEYHLIGKAQSLGNAEDTANLSIQRLELLKTDFLREIRKEEIRLKMSERIISAYKPMNQSVQPLNAVDLSELERNDLYAQYLTLRSQINFAKGEEKIQLLKKILSDEEVIRKYEPEPEEALCRFWANLAQEYYLTFNFTESVKFYKKAELNFNKLPLHFQETLVLNYILSLMRNENFEEARNLALQHTGLLMKSKILSSRSPFLIAVLHLYARDADGAEKFGKIEGKKEGSEFYFFMRLVLSAVYYLRDDLDLAVRESVNLDQAVNYEMNREQTLQTKISKPIVSVFRRFYSIVQNVTTDKQNNELKVLEAEINSYLVSNSDQSPNSILTQWINKEISFLLSKKGRRNYQLN